ncbi:hypothetical protein [Escherichia phage vB_EcoM_EP32a]|nr:hypothetical protein [Escherichia phage vB_EcoM_EP32a]
MGHSVAHVRSFDSLCKPITALGLDLITGWIGDKFFICFHFCFLVCFDRVIIPY